jgi:Cytochrome C oxidase, cbb3-type, subunit III
MSEWHWLQRNKEVRMSYLARLSTAAFSLGFALLGVCADGKAEPSGESDFRMSCTTCHGEDGRGAGTKAFGLSGQPPDLTTLRRRNGGTFPRERLRRIIDGREDIALHSEREMPVWGQLFKFDAEEGLGGAEGDDATVQRRIEALIDFIESLQR